MRSVHVFPIGDRIYHDAPGTDPQIADVDPDGWLAVQDRADDPPVPRCVCDPLVKVASPAGAPSQWLVIHHALDGRTRTEGSLS